MKVYSHEHKANEEKRKVSRALNEAFYSNTEIFNGHQISVEKIEDIRAFQMQHGQHPRK